MVEWSAIAGIAAVALGLVLTPGPNMIYLVSRSITQGRRAGAADRLSPSSAQAKEALPMVRAPNP